MSGKILVNDFTMNLDYLVSSAQGRSSRPIYDHILPFNEVDSLGEVGGEYWGMSTRDCFENSCGGKAQDNRRKGHAQNTKHAAQDETCPPENIHVHYARHAPAGIPSTFSECGSALLLDLHVISLSSQIVMIVERHSLFENQHGVLLLCKELHFFVR